MQAQLDTKKHLRFREHELFASLGSIDWESPDFESLAEKTQDFLYKFAADKKLFKELLLAVPEDPYLWSKCEEDVAEDKIVLWDDIENNFRIRLRMSTKSQERLAHNHRFSFSNLVLRGKYIHWHYLAKADFNELTALDEVEETCIHEDRAGDCFTIHHNFLHSTPFPEPGTVSLVLRGNPLKRRAPVMFKEARGREEALMGISKEIGLEYEPENAVRGSTFWRIGEEEESAERRAERRMTLEKYNYWVDQLEKWNLI